LVQDLSLVHPRLGRRLPVSRHFDHPGRLVGDRGRQPTLEDVRRLHQVVVDGDQAIEPLPGLRVDEMDRGVDGHMVKYASGPRARPAPSSRPDNVAVVANRRERIVDQMANDERHPRADGAGIVELTRVQPIEAEVIAARLRAAGIPATVPADSVYPSLTFAN